MSFQKFLEKVSDNYESLYFGALSSSDPVLIQIIQEFFPHIEWTNNYVGGSTFLFNKKGSQNDAITQLDFENSNEQWKGIDALRVTDSISNSGKRSYFYSKEDEWGPVYTCKLGDIIKNHNDFIDLSVKIRSSDLLDDIILVASIEDIGKTVYWGGTNGKSFPGSENYLNKWITFNHSIRLADAKSTEADLVLKVLLWNRGRRTFFMDDFRIGSRAGNPIQYGLSEKF